MSEVAPDAVLTTRQGNILIITLNRPEARNAVNAAVHIGVGQALEQAENDPEIRVVIITGSGDQAFCAGADLKAVSRGERIEPDDATMRGWGFAGMVSHPISKPVIAAVNGFALGGGTELALASDLVVAADHAQFGLPEVKRGLFAAAGGAFRIVQQLPQKLAMELLLTGEPISAQRAAELGFANRVVQEEAFGPILPMIRFTDLDDVIAKANDSEYGLAGSVWAGDVEVAGQIARRLDSGTVWINHSLGLLPSTPFAGRRQSGMGVENGRDGLLEFTQRKAIYTPKAKA